MTKALTKIQDGDSKSGAYVQISHSQAIRDYEDAQKLWPFLRYNSAFTSHLRDEKSALAHLLTTPSVMIYFKNPLDSNGMTNLTQTIKMVPEVTKVSYISQEEALAIYKEQNKGIHSY